MNISIIIPAYNSDKILRRTLKRLLSGIDARVLEVILVDSSEDKQPIVKLVRGLNNHKVKVIHSGTKVIPAISRNVGAREAKGDLLVFIDSDVYPGKPWLTEIIEAYNEGYAAGGGSVYIAVSQKNNLLAIAQLYLQFNEYLPYGKPRVKPFLPSCNLFCRRDIFEQIGGFPEIRASEDVLFGLKLSKTEKYYFLPKAVVYHVFRTGWRDFMRNQHLLGKYIFIYRKRHYKNIIYMSWISILGIPVVFMYKYIKMLVTVLRAGFIESLRFVIATPVIFTGLFSWCSGYIEGCLYGE